MKEKKFKWYNIKDDPIYISKVKSTGLTTIPGCQAYRQNGKVVRPKGVLFNGKHYHSYAISPFGAIILGTKGVYSQKLSQSKILPETDQPLIIPFGEVMQVKA